MATTSLLDWILSILRDPDQRAAFQHDPEDYARDHGFTDLSSADVHDALLLIGDNQSASYDHQHSVHYPPPQHYDNHEHAGHYLNHYITNNYKVIDDHDTNIDNSIHQKIDNRGGDFHQTVDNDTVIASGDHAVAAGGNIENLATGDRAVAGDGSQVSGDHSPTAFGQGDAANADFDHADFGSGSGVAVGDSSASGHSEDNDSTTSVHGGHGATSVNTVGSHSDDARQEADQSEHDDSTHIHVDDNHQSDSNNEVLSHDHGSIEDVQHVL